MLGVIIAIGLGIAYALYYLPIYREIEISIFLWGFIGMGIPIAIGVKYLLDARDAQTESPSTFFKRRRFLMAILVAAILGGFSEIAVSSSYCKSDFFLYDAGFCVVSVVIIIFVCTVGFVSLVVLIRTRRDSLDLKRHAEVEKRDRLENEKRSRTRREQEVETEARLHREEENRLQRLKQVIRIADRLTIQQLGEFLGVNASEIREKVYEWAGRYHFQVVGEELIFEGEKVDAFIAALEQEFRTWGKGTGVNENSSSLVAVGPNVDEGELPEIEQKDASKNPVTMLLPWPGDARRKMEEEERIQKLHQVMMTSDRISARKLAEILGMAPGQLWAKVPEWAGKYRFRVVRDDLVFQKEDIDSFIAMLDKEFKTWTNQGKKAH